MFYNEGQTLNGLLFPKYKMKQEPDEHRWRWCEYDGVDV